MRPGTGKVSRRKRSTCTFTCSTNCQMPGWLAISAISAVESVVGGVEAVMVAALLQFVLFIDEGSQRGDLLGVDAPGGAAHGQILQRGAHQDRFGQGGDRDAGDEGAGLRKYLHQLVAGKPQQRLAHRRAADAMRERQLLFVDRLSGRNAHRDDVAAQRRINEIGGGVPAQLRNARRWARGR